MTKEIEELRYLAYAANLDNKGILEKYSLEELEQIYNGIGPDRFPSIIRDALNVLHPTLLPAVLIHDVEYYEGGSREEYKASNARLGANGCKLAKFNYTWYNPYRYWVMHDANKFAKICDRFGWSGWNKVLG